MVNYKTAILNPVLTEHESETIKKINDLRVNHDFRAIKKIIGKENIAALLAKLYPKNDITTIEKILNVPDSILGCWFRNLGIPLVRRHVSTEMFPANFDGSTVIAFGNSAKNLSAIKIGEDLAYMIGFCIGDGAVQKFMVEAFNKDKGMKEYLKATMEKYGTVQEVYRDDGLWKLRLSSVKIAALIKKNGTISEDTLDYIFSEEGLAPRFLAGLWDAEGSVLRQGNYIHVYLYNADKRLLDRISEYLNFKGIKNSIIEIKKRVEPYCLGGRPVIARKQIYRLGVPKSHIGKWAELIGLHLKHSKKSTVVLEIEKKEMV
ncbi:MAG TPA: LAGLIDADG family homing endonuclease [archaeon]|nr:LAGLIDADG family homing endonuclease [archaeon]